MFVYIISNSVNGKYYIGKTVGKNLEYYLSRQFWCAHHQDKSRTSKPHLFNAMRKHPRECWSIAPLIQLQTEEDLLAAEKFLIEIFGARRYGYNICAGGRGAIGYHHTPEARAKIVASRNWEKAAETNRGVPRSIDIRAKISKSNLGKIFSSDTREKLRLKRLLQRDPRLGTHHSEASKKRMSDAKKGCIGTFLGKHHTDQSKEKCRLAHLLNLQGQQFGNVLVVSLAGTPRGHAEWVVRCVVCGTEGTAKRSGRVKSGDSAFMRAHLHPVT